MRDRKHLKRLYTVSIATPVFFVTICVANRRPVLAAPEAFAILRGEWAAARDRYGWAVGRFVVMPDHVHFFCACDETAHAKPLSGFIGGFKQWTSKAILKHLGLPAPLWQKEFFDHLLRNDESYAVKWDYVRDNPVRAGLARSADDWPYAGEITPISR
ncbi:putative transposase [Roseiarcus fermentans]|uniref:Putative transposase n=1 Tax=Roseiarcus fermentans TaxID=1473586 RepID=A0A366EVQ5_9HYPH|nr:transposase [Roseiarcus fermentans]RBP06414.1 putative transposase [Roseiarcus fermentans]